MHMHHFSNGIIIAFLTAQLLMLGGCSNNDGGQGPATTAPAMKLRGSNDVIGLFGYSKGSNRMFIKKVSNGKFDADIFAGTGQLPCDSMTVYQAGGSYFIMGHRTSGNWFIEKILPSGDPGEVTDHGVWNHYYDTLTSFQVGERTYIFGQRSDRGFSETYYWFIQQVDGNGKLGGVADFGNWKSFYNTVVPFQVQGDTYLFLHTTTNNYWFIQKVCINGVLGKVSDGGN